MRAHDGAENPGDARRRKRVEVVASDIVDCPSDAVLIDPTINQQEKY